MATNTDKLSRYRIGIVTVIALSYLFCEVMSLTFVQSWSGLSDVVLERIDNIGVVVYLAAIACFGLWGLKYMGLGSPDKQALSDELVKHNMNRAMQFGYKLLFVIAMVLFILTKDKLDPGFNMTPGDVARITLTSVLVFPYLRFAWLESCHA